MVDLVLRPSELVEGRAWALQLRWHESLGETEYHTLARVSDDVAREIKRAGAPDYLFSDQAPAAPSLFALRRKRDGRYMPDYKGRAGGTYVDPDKPATHTGTPRLFTSAKAAGDALRWWVKGRVRVRWSGPGFDSLDGPEVSGLESEPVAGRNADDWEIVPVGIHQRDADAVQV